MGAPTAPIRPSAKSNRHHSTLVAARIAKASPFSTPSARSPFAMSSTRRAASPPETGTQLPSRSARYAVRSGFRADAFRHRAPIVRVICAELTAKGTGFTPRIQLPHAHDLERIDQLQSGHDSRRARPGDEAVRARIRHLVPAAARRVQDADQEPSLVPGARAGGDPGRDRPRLGG